MGVVGMCCDGVVMLCWYNKMRLVFVGVLDVDVMMNVCNCVI